MNDKDEENLYEIQLSARELVLVIMAMSASNVPMNLQKETFELVQRFRNTLDGTT